MDFTLYEQKQKNRWLKINLPERFLRWRERGWGRGRGRGFLGGDYFEGGGGRVGGGAASYREHAGYSRVFPANIQHGHGSFLI